MVLKLTVLSTILVQPFLSLMPSIVKADASTWHVPGDFNTIQEAIDNASNDDIIIVHSGTYDESISVSKRLMIQGEDKATTFIDGLGSWAAVTIYSEDTEFSGFTVHNGDYGIYALDAEGVFIFDCIIWNCTWSGIRSDKSDSLLIENCTIYVAVMESI